MCGPLFQAIRLCQNAGLFGASRAVAAAEIHRAETGSISTIMLPVMETRDKLYVIPTSKKEMPIGTLVHSVFRYASVLYYL